MAKLFITYSKFSGASLRLCREKQRLKTDACTENFVDYRKNRVKQPEYAGKVPMIIRALVMVVLTWAELLLHAQSDTCSIHLFPDSLLSTVNTRMFGTNFTSNRNYAYNTVGDAGYLEAAAVVSPSIIRWPGGNVSDIYDWKRRQLVKPGRRIPTDDRINWEQLLPFVRSLGSELSITINFGTMTADDAADMVEFCNGDAATEWGARRDSLLASLGLIPGALNIRYFEIGNETLQLHMWENSWTAENPKKYFLGGTQERRGVQIDPFGALGDFFPLENDSLRMYRLRFTPARDFLIQGAVIPPFLMQNILDGLVPGDTLTAMLDTLPRFDHPDDIPEGVIGYSIIDSLTGKMQFGHLTAIPENYYILAEYTVYDQDGFLEYARKMKAVDPDILTGANMLPRYDDGSIPDSMQVPTDSLAAIFDQMDFFIIHQYERNNDPQNMNYAGRRMIPLARMLDLHDHFSAVTALNNGIPVPVALTEWNIFNRTDSLVYLNRSLETAVLGSEFLIRLLNDPLPVWFAQQFTLSIMGDNFPLIQTDSDHAVNAITPLGWALSGMNRWSEFQKISLSVTSPGAYSDSVWIPFIHAAACMDSNTDTIRVVITNSALTDTVLCLINGEYDRFNGVFLRRITGTHSSDSNTNLPDNVTLSQAEFTTWVSHISLPPHSVTFADIFAGRTGDLNRDGVLDVLDVVDLVNLILTDSETDDYLLWAGDLNNDDQVNIMDIVEIVDIILRAGDAG